MKKPIKRFVAAVAIACSCFTTLSAATCNKCDTPPQCDTPPPCPTPCPTSSCKDTSVAGQPSKDNNYSMFIAAAYTLWTAREDGLKVALANYYIPSSATGTQGSVQAPEFTVSSGFKVALGAYLDYDSWMAQAEYTWFNNNPGSTSAEFEPFLAINSQADSLTPSLLYSASSKWRNQFNRIDATLSKSFYVGDYLMLTPFMGLLGAWETQHLKIYYFHQISQQTSWKAKQNWWTVGPYMGVENNFIVLTYGSQSWSFFIHGGTEIGWSQFKVTTNILDASNNTIQDSKETIFLTDPMLELLLGLRWEATWCNSWMFALDIGWELQTWFEHNKLVTNNHGNYTMQGLTVKAKLAF